MTEATISRSLAKVQMATHPPGLNQAGVWPTVRRVRVDLSATTRNGGGVAGATLPKGLVTNRPTTWEGGGPQPQTRHCPLRGPLAEPLFTAGNECGAESHTGPGTWAPLSLA